MRQKRWFQKMLLVITDGKTSYRVLENIAKKHKSVIVKDKTQVSKIFPWVHIVHIPAKVSHLEKSIF